MLHILWLIIKFILIILGIAGALLLSVLLLLLFCPVRYLIQGSKPEEGGMSGLKGQVRVSWLFRGITFRFFYENKETKTDFRIFGISDGKFRRRKKKASEKSARPEEKISDENISAEKEENRCLRYRDLTLDLDGMEAVLAGRSLDLTTREFELLQTLISSPGRVFTREVLLAKLWGYDFFGDERVVDSHIKNLRRKLGTEYIETVRGVGYRAAKENP